MLVGAIAALLVAPALAAPAPAAAQSTASGGAPILQAVVSPGTAGNPMPAGFVGLSLEYTALLSYAGSDPGAINPVFLALVRGLAPSGSPVLRIGGDSTDRTWWPVPGMQAPAGIQFTLSANWLAVMHALAAQLGARVIPGINIAADNPSLAAAEAGALLSGIGSRYVEALEIGNEPDLYTTIPLIGGAPDASVFARGPGYDPQQYIAEFTQLSGALPAAPLAGPAFSSMAWLPYLMQFMASSSNVAVVTYHAYPLSACGGNAGKPTFPSIPNLLADSASQGLAQRLAPYAWIAHSLGEQFRVDEINSVACQGEAGVSNTFASALWMLDTLFNLAAAGVDGVNVHTLPGSNYQPFSFTYTNDQWTATVNPVYYGMLAFTQAFPPGARLLSVSAPSGPVKIWATRSASGELHFVVINEDPSTAAVVRIELDGISTPTPGQPLTSEPLQAPSLGSTSGISLGGESFAANTTIGFLPSNPQPALIAQSPGGYYSVRLPAASAVLLSAAPPAPYAPPALYAPPTASRRASHPAAHPHRR